MVRRVSRAEARIRRIVAKLTALDQVPHGVDAESIDPASKPVTHHLVDGRPDGRVAPVEIWLSGEKGVIVRLSACAIIFPGAAAEYRQPIVGRTAVCGWIPPDVPVAFATSSRGSTLQEPGCRPEVWLGTRSRMTLRPCAWAAASRASKSSKLPNSGSMPV